MSKRRSGDSAEPPREFPNTFPDYDGRQLITDSGEVDENSSLYIPDTTMKIAIQKIQYTKLETQ
jgi:hypothetical protein